MMHQKRNRVHCIVRAALHGGLLAGCLSLGTAAYAGITFQFQYGDPADTGFLDPIHGASRQAALNTAAQNFSTMFGSHFSNSATIVLTAKTKNEPGMLASAGSDFTNPGKAGFNLGEVVRTKLQKGSDLNGDDPDGVVNINFGAKWELDFNTPPAEGWGWYQGTYDFYRTLYHEFTHTLGFSPLMTQSGASAFGTKDGSWSKFASFIVDKNNNPIIDPNTFVLNQAAWDTGSVGNWGGQGPEGLFFNGANAVAANGGFLVTLYTADAWEPGSSVSHLDDRMSGIEGTLMSPASYTGPQMRDYSAVEIGILKDLGYVAVVPEPEAYAMLLAGLAVLGAITRRRVSGIAMG
jgi:PEP-CTERM putative exosortase interaction domain